MAFGIECQLWVTPCSLSSVSSRVFDYHLIFPSLNVHVYFLVVLTLALFALFIQSMKSDMWVRIPCNACCPLALRIHSRSFALAASRDYTKVASGGSIVHRLLQPMTFEMKTGQNLLLRVRQQYMRALYEREWEQERVEFKRLKMSLRSIPAPHCCALPGWHRRAR